MNTDQKNKLKAFAASSNWSMLLSHSLDKQKWGEFMAAAKASPNDIADGEVYGVIKGTTTNPCPDDIAGRMEYLCRKGKQGRIKRFVAGVKESMKGLFGFACLMMPLMSAADMKVSDVKVFSGYPWKEVVVGYTITGKDTGAGAEDDVVQLTATDKSANKTYTAHLLTGAETTEGRHVLRWNAAAEGAKFSSANVVFSVSIVRLVAQLWENGPYWAACNVGAKVPEESGYYFMWGETVGYKRNLADNGWVSVKDGSSFSFDNGHCPTYGRDFQNLQHPGIGYIDATGNLVAAHDAATRDLGAPWRMPTITEFRTLISTCTTRWTTRNGVYGYLVTGKGAYSSNSIFLPASGSGIGSDLNSLGSYGGYWSSSPAQYGTPGRLNFDSGHFNYGYSGHSDGLPVRPVR